MESNVFYRLEAELQTIFAGSGPSAVSTQLDAVAGSHGISGKRYLIELIGWLNEAIEVAAHLKLPDTRAKRMMELLMSIQENLVQAFQYSSLNDLIAVVGRTAPEMLGQIGDTVATSNIMGDRLLDRTEFVAVTQSLILAVAKADMQPYQKEALKLKLTALVRLLEACPTSSDDSIRKQVKAIYADYCAEFTEFDKGNEELREKLTRWAKGIMRPGLFALSLTADASAVIGLLPPPDAGG